MAEELNIPREIGRAEKYQRLYPALESLLEGEDDLIANMANFVGALMECFDFLWIGFYRLQGSELVLGPFQGPLACTRIKVGSGVCGASVREGRSILVPDVEKFPGHIACSSRSRSELVVPVRGRGIIQGVLDLDSEKLDDFSALDQHHLERLVELLAKHY
jgi:GAF domain-containing protein